MEGKTIIDTQVNNFKRGIDLQRELFKNAKASSDMSLMFTAVENIKSEVKAKAKHSNLTKKIDYIEKRLDWIRGLRSKYTVKTRNGMRYRPPRNWKEVSIGHLNHCYEKIMEVLTELRLL